MKMVKTYSQTESQSYGLFYSIKYILRRREDTYLAHVCRHRWRLLQLMKATVLAETSYFINFHRGLSAPRMSTDVSYEGVALFFPI